MAPSLVSFELCTRDPTELETWIACRQFVMRSTMTQAERQAQLPILLIGNQHEPHGFNALALRANVRLGSMFGG